MEIQLRDLGQAVLIEVSGELDRESVSSLDATLDRVWSAGAQVAMIDLRRVEFLDSSGIQSLVLASRRAERERRQLETVEGGPHITMLLRRYGLFRVLNVAATAEELLEQLKDQPRNPLSGSSTPEEQG